VTVAADRDELPQKFFADVIVGQVMDLGCLRAPAAFAKTASALQDKPPTFAPRAAL
jgi:hypothetical protein